MSIERQNTQLSELNHGGRASATPPGVATGATSGGQSTPEGWATGSAAAGLVQYKTSHHQQQVITCSTSENLIKRVKRLKRNVYLAGSLHSLPKAGFRPDQAWLITLTYDTLGTLGKGAHDWMPDQISKAMNRYRRWCHAHGHTCKTVRVAELQQKGTVHYHIAVWLPRGVDMPHWDKTRSNRSAFWPHGMTNGEKLRTNTGYLMKYLSKIGHFHRFPKGLRLSGTTGLDESSRSICSWHSLPAWIRTSYGVGEVARKRYGYVVKDTGEVIPPMFHCKYLKGNLYITQLREMPERWQCEGEDRFFGPYSTFPRAIH